MHIYMTLYVGILFYLLTPGILLTIPENGSKYTIAIVHALVFAMVYHLTHKYIWDNLYEKYDMKSSYIR